MKVEEEDLTFLKSQPLWTGCRNTPYVIRGGIQIDKCLIFVTNFRNSWVCKLNKEQIIKDKDVYNKSIQTTSFQGVLDLLELALKYDPQAEYSFQMNDQSLFYGYSNVIKIYTLTWVFNCIEIETEYHFKILINDIVNPLLLTVNSLENRCNTYKTALTQLEQDYIRRLNEKERQQYKQRDKEEDLSVFISDDQIDSEKICQINFTPVANYFIQYYAINKLNKMQQQAKKRQPQQQAEQNSNMKKKEQIWQTYEATLTDMFEGKSKQVVDIVNKEEKPDKSKNTKKKIGFL